MNQPKVSIIILNWNNVKDTLALLNDLENLNYPNFSVLVVDNASTDDSIGQLARYMEKQRRLAKSTLKVSLLPLSKNFGFAQGNNKGIAHAAREQPAYYLLLNNDTVIANDFLTILVTALEKDKENDGSLAAVNPTIYYASPEGEKTAKVWFAGSAINFNTVGAYHKTALPPLTAKNQVIVVPFLTGCCLLIRREAITALKELFDPAFFAYSEDVDLSFKLQNLGYTLGYVPNATIWHKLASSSGGPKSYSFWYYNIRNNFLILKRYARWHHWISYIPYFLFYHQVLPSIIGAIIKPRPDKPLRLAAIARAAVDATFNHYGPLLEKHQAKPKKNK